MSKTKIIRSCFSRRGLAALVLIGVAGMVVTAIGERSLARLASIEAATQGRLAELQQLTASMARASETHSQAKSEYETLLGLMHHNPLSPTLANFINALPADVRLDKYCAACDASDEAQFNAIFHTQRTIAELTAEQNATIFSGMHFTDLKDSTIQITGAAERERLTTIQLER